MVVTLASGPVDCVPASRGFGFRAALNPNQTTPSDVVRAEVI